MATSGKSHPAGSTAAAMLPAIVAIILTLIWGGYTALVLVEIFSTPVPAA
jgi:hypothetical protein